jgi:cytochrome c
VVPDDFTLSDANVRDVQAKLPNRNGMTTDHAMWPGGESAARQPDVRAVACMSGCGPEPRIASSLPDFARNQHGNLAEQNRRVGPQRGADTTRPPAATLAETAARARAPMLASAAGSAAGASAAAGSASAPGSSAAWALAQQNACTACHGLEGKLVGPSFVDIARRHGTRADAVDYLAGRIRAGGSGAWGSVPMPPQALGEADARTIAQWLAAGARQ